MAGSRSTAPLNRSNSVLIVAQFSLSGLCLRGALHEERKGSILRNALVIGDGASWQLSFNKVQSMNSN
jgi:hypothetical protein